jgi:REP element-mobilizing transposase RayT
MSSYICNLVHFVWGTANREPVIEKSWRDRLHAYIGGILANRNAVPLAVGGVADHVHVLASLPSTVTLAEIASAMKANSSRWIHEQVPQCKGFDWQTGYGAFSVSKSAEGRVTAYIANQEEHHRRMKFEDEFKSLLERHGIAYEARYLWV